MAILGQRLFVVVAVLLACQTVVVGAKKKAPSKLDKKLTKAIESGSAEDAEAAITGGANVNRKYRSGMTVLHKAAKSGHGDIVQLLLAGGADFSVKNKEGKVASEVATDAAVAVFESFAAKAAEAAEDNPKAKSKPKEEKVKAEEPAKEENQAKAEEEPKPKVLPARAAAALRKKKEDAKKAAKAAKVAAEKKAEDDAAAEAKATAEAAAAEEKAAAEAAAAKDAAAAEAAAAEEKAAAEAAAAEAKAAAEVAATEAKAAAKKAEEEAAVAAKAAEEAAAAAKAEAEEAKKAAEDKEAAAKAAEEEMAKEKAKADAMRKGPIGKIARHGSVRSGSALFRELDSKKARKVGKERFQNVIKNLRVLEKPEAGAAFDLLDKDGDKWLTLRELLAGFAAVQEACTAPAPVVEEVEEEEAPPPPPQLTPLQIIATHLQRKKSRVKSGRALYKLLDTSNIGFVREDRFIKTMKNSRILTAEEGKDAFLHLDIDYDDKLTMRELLIGVNNAFNV